MIFTLVAALAVAAPLQDSAAADRAFDAMDANKDGKVERAEYSRYLQSRLERQTTAMDAAHREMDKNKDGQISKAEAAAVPVIASAFDALDADKSGGLSIAEMRAALAKAHAAQADAEAQ